MIPEIVSIPDQCPTELLAEDELLIVLGPPSRAGAVKRSSWVHELVEKSVNSLSKKEQYLAYHVGFLRQGNKSPYVVLDWQKPGNSALERRWVAHRLAATLLSMFNLKKYAVLLERGSGELEMVLAEDLLTRHMAPLYDATRLDHLRILTPEKERLRAADPHHLPRWTNQHTFRQWVNEDPDTLTSIEIGARLAKFCQQTGCHFESLEVPELTRLGMNLLLAVGQASERSPSRLHIATHNVKPGDKPLLLIGKGITFDTGGINLKAHESHVNCMKNDMGGAGLMATLFMALVTSGYNGPLALALPCCENLIGERAMKPGAIIRSYAGKDVLIEHTDAEGRLILADTIAYTEKHLNPALSLVGATLTTASLRQFSNYFTAVHFASDRLQAELRCAGSAWGEEFSYWGEFLPFLQGNKTNAADLTNMGRLPSHASIGGACNVAAHFLKEFATRPLVHFDIFATTWNWGGDYPGAHYGATGAPFNTLFDCLRRSDAELWGYR